MWQVEIFILILHLNHHFHNSKKFLAMVQTVMVIEVMIGKSNVLIRETTK